MNPEEAHATYSARRPISSYSGAFSQSGISNVLRSRRAELVRALDQMEQDCRSLLELAELIVGCLRDGGKILIAGNGGSAAEAQHIAAELVGRFQRERAPYPAVALSTDTSILTAIANDYGYEQVFARQIAGLGKPGDLFLALSTSGNSINLVRGARTASESGLFTASLTGSAESQLSRRCDVNVHVPASSTPLIQELHLLAGHVLCELIENQLSSIDRSVADD